MGEVLPFDSPVSAGDHSCQDADPDEEAMGELSPAGAEQVTRYTLTWR